MKYDDYIFEHIFKHALFYKDKIKKIFRVVKNAVDGVGKKELLRKIFKFVDKTSIELVFDSQKDLNHLVGLLESYDGDNKNAIKENVIQAASLFELNFGKLKSFPEKNYKSLISSQIANFFSSLTSPDDFKKIKLFYDFSKELGNKVEQQKETDKDRIEKLESDGELYSLASKLDGYYQDFVNIKCCLGCEGGLFDKKFYEGTHEDNNSQRAKIMKQATECVINDYDNIVDSLMIMMGFYSVMKK